MLLLLCYASLLLEQRLFLPIQARINKKCKRHYDGILLAKQDEEVRVRPER